MTTQLETTPISRIADMVGIYGLTSEEKTQLMDFVEQNPGEDFDDLLPQLLQSILAERRFRTMQPLSIEEIDRARRAVEEGRTSFVLQDVE